MASNVLTKRETSNYLVYIGQISDSKTRLIIQIVTVATIHYKLVQPYLCDNNDTLA